MPRIDRHVVIHVWDSKSDPTSMLGGIDIVQADFLFPSAACISA